MTCPGNNEGLGDCINFQCNVDFLLAMFVILLLLYQKTSILLGSGNTILSQIVKLMKVENIFVFQRHQFSFFQPTFCD